MQQSTTDWKESLSRLSKIISDAKCTIPALYMTSLKKEKCLYRVSIQKNYTEINIALIEKLLYIITGKWNISLERAECSLSKGV